MGFDTFLMSLIYIPIAFCVLVWAYGALIDYIKGETR